MQPTAHRSRLRFAVALAGLACASCSSSPSTATVAVAADSGARVVDLARTTEGFTQEIPVDARATPVTRVPTGSTVFFRNPDPSRFVILKLSGDFHGCKDCATVTGFACLQSGATSQAIQPGGIVSLCFHDAGRFPFEVRGGDTPLGGIVEVYAR
ncbi:MAG TPA: hypothetical protein VKE69_00640 [Planctomycetota bacterium]|nr:hypothetical protein [Planctomycetota bacterium]